MIQNQISINTNNIVFFNLTLIFKIKTEKINLVKNKKILNIEIIKSLKSKWGIMNKIIEFKITKTAKTI